MIVFSLFFLQCTEIQFDFLGIYEFDFFIGKQGRFIFKIGKNRVIHTSENHEFYILTSASIYATHNDLINRRRNGGNGKSGESGLNDFIPLFQGIGFTLKG